MDKTYKAAILAEWGEVLEWKDGFTTYAEAERWAHGSRVMYRYVWRVYVVDADGRSTAYADGYC